MRVHLLVGLLVASASAACSTLPSTPKAPEASTDPTLAALLAAPAPNAAQPETHAAAPQLPGEYDVSVNYEAPPAPEPQAAPEPRHQKLPPMASQGQRKAQLFALPVKNGK